MAESPAMGDRQELLGVWARYAFPVGLTGAIVCAAVAVSSFLPGAPYFPEDKGELTEISKDEYDERRTGKSRTLSAVPGIFYVVGAAIGHLARKGSVTDEAPAVTP